MSEWEGGFFLIYFISLYVFFYLFVIFFHIYLFISVIVDDCAMYKLVLKKFFKKKKIALVHIIMHPE